ECYGADADMSFATHVELSGSRRNRRATVQSGMSATSLTRGDLIVVDVTTYYLLDVMCSVLLMNGGLWPTFRRYMVYSKTVVSVGRSMVGRHAVVELEALIEGLNAAVRLGLKRVHVYCDNVSVYRYLMGEAWPTTNTVMTLVDRFNLIHRTFTDCGLFLVGPSDIKFAYELARDAIIFQTTNFEEDTFGKTLVEECTICYHEIERDQMFSVNQCHHTYCLPCMRKHVEAKLLQGQLPGCPHENCKSELQIGSCKKFLTPKLYNIMSIRVKEAAIPPTEKVYCPFPNCSELMSKTEVLEYTNELFIAARGTSMRKCVKCHRLFCINCNAPWHKNISCSDYMKKNQYGDEAKLTSLAASNRWRQCSRCKNMAELADRCGYEFCYTCGAEYIDKKATCKCPLWDEGNIIYRQRQQNRRL
nr:ribonuclease H domain-containing protein [Tanacetum cinerariifolium]